MLVRELNKRSVARFGRSPLMSLTVFGIVLLILAYLVAIDRAEWFRIRPATGTAVALSHASTPPAAEQGQKP